LGLVVEVVSAQDLLERLLDLVLVHASRCGLLGASKALLLTLLAAARKRYR